MVRRSKSSKAAEKANAVNANLEKDGFQHGLTNQSSRGKYLKPSEKLTKKTKAESVRRSQRIQNTSTSAQSKSQPISEEIVITVTEEQDEDEPSGQEAEKLFEPGENDSSMEEQGEYEPSGQKVGKLPEPAQNGLTLEGQAGDVASDSEENDEDESPGEKVDKLTEPAQNGPTMEEQDGDEPSGNEEEELPVVAQNEKIEEKIDYLIQLVEAQKKTIEELKPKASDFTGQMPDKSLFSPDARYKSMYFESQKKIEALTDDNCQMALKLEKALGKLEVASDFTGQMPDKSLFSPDARYKSMYFESQKKIEALTDDNRQMALKLENALGKLEVYEKGQNNVYSEVLDKVKDFIQFTNQSKFTETACLNGVSPDNAPEEPTTTKKKRKGVSQKSG